VEQGVEGLRKAGGAAQPGQVSPVLVATHVSSAVGAKNSMRVVERAGREGPAQAGRVAAGKVGGPVRECTLEQSEVHERGTSALRDAFGRWTREDPEGPVITTKTEGGSFNPYDDTASADIL
jgi:hypothetical protein